MGEIDRKPIESVQAALSFFGQKSNQRKHRSTRSEEMEKEKEFDSMQKELASYKVQLEINESAHMQALLELKVCHKTVEEFSTQLNNSEAERDKYIQEYGKAKAIVVKVESENTELLAKLLESENARQGLQVTLNEMKTTKDALKIELDAAEEANHSALREAELMETAVEMEKENSRELLKYVSKLNEDVHNLKLGAIEAEKEKTARILAKDEEIEIAYEQLKEINRQLDRVKNLEDQITTKSLLIESLQSELMQEKDSVSNAMEKSESLKQEVEQMSKSNSFREIFIQSIETELQKSREELKIVRDEAENLNHQLVLVTVEMQKLEIKESAHMQALLELEVYHKTVEEFSTHLNDSEAERDKYIEEYVKVKACLDKLESENTDLLAKLLENENARQGLQVTLDEMKTIKEALKVELDAAKEAKDSALREAELMETLLEMEKENTKELLRHVSELNEAVLYSNLATIEAEKEKTATILAKDEEIEIAREQLEEIQKELDTVKNLEDQLTAKSILVESLQSQLMQAKDSVSNAVEKSESLKLEVEQMGRANFDREIFIQSMETELQQSREDLKTVRGEAENLNHQLVLATAEMQRIKNGMAQLEERDSEALIEIASLKSELHKGKAKIAGAEASEARARSVTSGLYLAVQQLAIEADEAKEENLRLKQEAVKLENCPSDFCSGITISQEEYRSLLQRAEKAAEEANMPLEEATLAESENAFELYNLKTDLEAAKEEITHLRSVAAQAEKRAEMAEKAKAAVEDQLRKYRERNEKKRAAIMAIKEESNRWGSTQKPENKQSNYQPLGKVLNMKF